MDSLLAILHQAPIIAAIRGKAQLSPALTSKAKVIFLLGAELMDLPSLVAECLHAGKQVFVHLDLVEGISRDPAGVRYIARTARPTGIISTRAPLLKTAAEEGLLSVLRIFLVDSSSMASGVRMVRACHPTLVEVMPGLLPRAIAQLKENIPAPLIAGGMVEKAEELRAALVAGALAVSTSKAALWNLQGGNPHDA